MVQIIPAILTNSPEEFEKAACLIEPYATRIHLDVADGIFVPNKTIKGYSELELASAVLKFDVHLMVKNPLSQLTHWYDKEKADRFVIHIESEDALKTVSELKNMNKSVGIALNPDTPNETVEPLVGLVDFVQFMTISPGFQGRAFLDQVVGKIESFSKKHPEVIVAVDGGINSTTAKSVIEAGADILVSGSFILKSGDVGKAIEELIKISENNR